MSTYYVYYSTWDYVWKVLYSEYSSIKPQLICQTISSTIICIYTVKTVVEIFHHYWWIR